MSAFIRDHIFMIWMTKNNIWAQVLCGADSAPPRLLDWADENSWFSHDFFFFETQNFQKFYIKPPKFLILTCFKHQKRKLHCILTLITDLGLKWQAIKWAWGGIRPITAWLGLRQMIHFPLHYEAKEPHWKSVVFKKFWMNLWDGRLKFWFKFAILVN